MTLFRDLWLFRNMFYNYQDTDISQCICAAKAFQKLVLIFFHWAPCWYSQTGAWQGLTDSKCSVLLFRRSLCCTDATVLISWGEHQKYGLSYGCSTCKMLPRAKSHETSDNYQCIFCDSHTTISIVCGNGWRMLTALWRCLHIPIYLLLCLQSHKNWVLTKAIFLLRFLMPVSLLSLHGDLSLQSFSVKSGYIWQVCFFKD